MTRDEFVAYKLKLALARVERTKQECIGELHRLKRLLHYENDIVRRIKQQTAAGRAGTICSSEAPTSPSAGSTMPTMPKLPTKPVLVPLLCDLQL